ncbi:MAG: tRNA threonylcarbamoyladenosine biosynthesis protein RimN [Haemophilus parainfluenzae]|jgi:protein rimN|nr:MAG: tRNA threonylcarbamoyladenosine biosynthesis protein RimN [Haemophilus parainfluenzae]
MKAFLPHIFIRHISSHLKKGGVIVYPTEACFGIGALPFHPLGRRRVLRLKKRNAQKGFILIGASLSDFKGLVQAKAQQNYQKQLLNTWPSNKTLLLPAKTTVPAALRGSGHKKIALRISAYPPTRLLSKRLHTPLISTSANVSGAKAIKSIREAVLRYRNTALVIPYRIKGDKKPSEIWDPENDIRLR